MLVLKWISCQTLGTGGVSILRIIMGWWSSEVHVKLLVVVITILRVSVGWWCIE